MKELSYGKIVDLVRENISEIFGFYSDSEVDAIADFLVHQGVDDVSKETLEKIKDYHVESSEENMFNWIHTGNNESPLDIKNAPYVEAMGNVLVLEDDTCIFWYDIGVDMSPYTPYDKEDYTL